MNVVPITPGTRGVDTDTPVSDTFARMLLSNRFDFVLRYLSDVTSHELATVLGDGLGVCLVTHSRGVGWSPSAALGTSDGVADVAQLKALGIPATMVIWIDLEGSGGSAADTAAWVNARAIEIVNAGYVAGVYVGNQCVLNAQQLYALPNVTRYWKAFNLGIPDVQCGFCMLQLYPPDQVIGGLEVDLDVTQQDYEGRLPTMLKS